MNKNRIRGVLYRHLTLWSRDFDKIAGTFWWPVIDLLIWGLVTVYLQRQSGVPSAAVTFFIGGVIFWGIINRAQLDIGLSFLDEAWDRNLLNLFASPLTRWEFITASFILGIIKASISLFVVSILAFLLYTFNIFDFSWYLIPFVANLIFMGWWIGVLMNALILRFGYRVQAFAWTLVLVFQPISGVFYPLSVLPYPIQVIARLFPSSYIFEGMRAVLDSGSFSYLLIIIATVLNVIYLGLAFWFYNRMFNESQKKGYLINFS